MLQYLEQKELNGDVNMKKRILIITTLLMLFINNIAFGFSGFENKAKAYLLADYETGQILESYNIDSQVEIASISKLLSYFVIMDEISKGNISFADRIIIDEDTAKVKGSSYDLKVGEVFSVEKLLKASIVISGNDATYAIAKHIAGSEAGFVKLMKNKAMNLGLKNAEIYNSSGLPINNDGLQNKMTTRELFTLVKKLLDTYPEILELSRIPFISEPSRGFLEMNTNPLLKIVDGIDGLKTGFTGKAGYCFVSTLNIKGEIRETEDFRLIGIIMGSKNYEERTEISKALAEYGKDNYIKKIFTHKELPLKMLEYPKGEPNEIEVYPEESFSQLIEKDSVIEMDLQFNNIELPINENTKLGTVTVLKNNKPIFTTSILNKEKVDAANSLTLGLRFYENLFNKIEILFAQ